MHENAQSVFSKGDIDNPYLFTFGITTVRMLEALRGEITITGDTGNGEEELYKKTAPLQSFTASGTPLKNSAALKERMYVINDTILNAQAALNAQEDSTVNVIPPVYEENDYIVGIGLANDDPVDFDTLFADIDTDTDITLHVKILYEKEALKEATVQVSKADPYHVYTWRDLQYVHDDLKGDYAVQNDIIFPEAGHYGFENFRPIGWPVKPVRASRYNWDIQWFTGTFEGNNHNIEGLRAVHNALSIGLFAQARNATIQNFTLYHSGVVGYVGVGSVIGRVEGGTVDNVHVYALDGAEVTGERVSGGLIGQASKGVAIKNSSVHTVVRSTETKDGGSSGGLVGLMQSRTESDGFPGTVQDSYATGDVYGFEDVGGLIGKVSSSSTFGMGRAFTGIYATGNVEGKENVGGLIGRVGGAEIFITGYATGDVQGKRYIGGLVGAVYLHISTTLTGYSAGNVEGCADVGGTVGGMIFRGGMALSGKKTVRVSGYSVGDISGCSRVGGFIGSALPWGYGFSVSSHLDMHWNEWATALANNIYDMKGYARGKITITDENADTAGLFLGNLHNAESPVGTLAAYISSLTTFVGAEKDTTGIDGNEIDISTVTDDNYRTRFDGLTFGDEAGQWTWVGAGKWPAINVGDISPAADQPIE